MRFLPNLLEFRWKLRLISKQKGMQLDANQVYDNVGVNTIQMNLMINFWINYKSLSGKKDPFCIARLITDFNYRYSTLLREKLDTLLVSYE